MRSLAPSIRRILGAAPVRHVIILVGGTMISQLIPLVMLGVFSRMYAAYYFGIQALLQMGGNVISPLASGFYEYAFPSARSKKRLDMLVTLTLIGLIGLTGIIALALALFGSGIASLFKLDAMGDWIYAYPLIIACSTLFRVSGYWLLRCGRFTAISISKIILAIATAATAWLMGTLGVASGLLIGMLTGLAVAALWGMIAAYRHGMRPALSAPVTYAMAVASHYRGFPLFGAIPTAISILATSAPLMIITAYYTIDLTGHYAVVRLLLAGATDLFAICIGQVVLKHLSDLIKARRSIGRAYLYALGGLFAIGFSISAGTYLLGPYLLRVYLGKDWGDSAQLASILAWNLMFWLMGNATAYAVMAIKKMHAIAAWQCSYGIAVIGLFWFRHLEFFSFVHVVAGLEILMYSTYIALNSWMIWRYEQAMRRR